MRECLRYIGLRCAYSHGVEFCDLLTSRTPSCAICKGMRTGSRSRKTMSAPRLYLLALRLMTGPSLAARWRSGKNEGRRNGNDQVACEFWSQLVLRIMPSTRLVQVSMNGRMNWFANVFPSGHDTGSMRGGMESSKLTQKDTPALFEKLDCMWRSTFTKIRRECVYCE